MSDYDDKETSISDSAPYELFEFVGTYKSYYMTSDNLPHTFGGRTYNPTPGLKRNNLKINSNEDDSSDIYIEVPITEQIAKDCAFQITPPSLSLTIYRFQRYAASYVPYWKGNITSVSVSNEFAKFQTYSKLGYIMQGNIPNVYIQPPCNNVLFDELCKVSRVSNSVDTEVTSISGNTISLLSLGSFAANWFVGGEIAITARNERRTIIAQSANTVTVNYEFSKLSVGTAVQVTAGCDHSYSGSNGCPKFSNQRNFGGCPFVPGESNNLFSGGIK